MLLCIQERGLRSGTVPAPLVVGLGKACEIAGMEMERDKMYVTALTERLLSSLRSRLDHIALNGDEERRVPGNVNVSFAYVEGESLLMGLKVSELR